MDVQIQIIEKFRFYNAFFTRVETFKQPKLPGPVLDYFPYSGGGGCTLKLPNIKRNPF